MINRIPSKIKSLYTHPDLQYHNLIRNVIGNGELKKTRNGATAPVFMSAFSSLLSSATLITFLLPFGGHRRRKMKIARLAPPPPPAVELIRCGRRGSAALLQRRQRPTRFCTSRLCTSRRGTVFCTTPKVRN